MSPNQSHFKGGRFPCQFYGYETSGIDVILGLDWMRKYTTEVKCKEKVAVVTTPKGERISVDVAVQVPPTATMNQLDVDVDLQNCVVNKFPNKFSDELLGMLPDQRH